MTSKIKPIMPCLTASIEQTIQEIEKEDEVLNEFLKPYDLNFAKNYLNYKIESGIEVLIDIESRYNMIFSCNYNSPKNKNLLCYVSKLEVISKLYSNNVSYGDNFLKLVNAFLFYKLIENRYENDKLSEDIELFNIEEMQDKIYNFLKEHDIKYMEENIFKNSSFKGLMIENLIKFIKEKRDDLKYFCENSIAIKNVLNELKSLGKRAF